jgi:hypothetical protein
MEIGHQRMSVATNSATRTSNTNSLRLSRRLSLFKILASIAAIAAFASGFAAPVAPLVQSDLDAFMQKVLASRDENWKKLQQYILDEKEQVEIRGPSNVPVWGERRDFSWYIREGYFIKSPIKVNGVSVPEDDRRKAEDTFLRRVKERDKHGQQPQRQRGAPERAEPEQPPKDLDSFLKQSRQPDFIDSAYFLRFKFEQGKYAFVGREQFDGREVLKIEYYPARLFNHEQDKEERKKNEAKPEPVKKPDPKEQQKKDREDELDATIERLMNKVSLVTIWVEPKSFQIVKYTFDNVNFDFLPAAWLVRVNDLKASMTMSQPFPDVWLPRDVDMFFSAMVAIGTFDGHYRIEYHDYKQATTSGRIK